jgi:hypothetical protein
MDRCVQVKKATEKNLLSSGPTEDESDLRTWEGSSRKPIVGTERILSAIQYGDSWSFTLKRPRCSKLHINGQGLRPFLQGAQGFHNLLKITPPSLFMLFRRSSIVTAYLKSWDTLTETSAYLRSAPDPYERTLHTPNYFTINFNIMVLSSHLRPVPHTVYSFQIFRLLNFPMRTITISFSWEP